MTSPQDIKTWIEQSLPNSIVESEGDGHHFEAIVICDDFQGMNTMARHRMVYTALGTHMDADIHALSLKTLTKEEYQGD